MATDKNEKAIAYYETALDYYEGRNGKEQNYKKAVNYFKKAADLEHVEAYYKLSECYFSGHGVKRSPELAGEWSRKAANAGHCEAQFDCGVISDFLQHYEQAAKWYRMAAEQGKPEAQYSLGTLYEIGEGVEEDFEEAEKWYSKAAEQGYKKAIKELKELREWLAEHPEKKKKKRKTQPKKKGCCSGRRPRESKRDCQGSPHTQDTGRLEHNKQHHRL